MIRYCRQAVEIQNVLTSGAQILETHCHRPTTDEEE